MQHGRYTVIRKLAEGGMAEIFLAKQHGSQGFEKPVVLKRIHAALYADEQFRNMLIDEAHISMALSHNNIVQVLDLGQAGGRYFLVLELVDGWDLGRLQRRAERANLMLPADLGLYVVAQICRALGYAHAKLNVDGRPLGIVHRDVSPQNVLISEQGEVKLADFGIAKARRKRENTEAGVVKGKIAFMSPEQALGQELDARSDLYSLGTLLYSLVVGRRPFEGATDLEVLLRVQNGQFTPPLEACPDLHPAIAALLDRAMQFDREARYHSADEMLADVESVLRASFGFPGQTELKQWLGELARLDGDLPIGRIQPGAVPESLAPEAEFKSGDALVLRDGTDAPSPRTPTRAATLPRVTGAEPTVADLRISGDLRIGGDWTDQETPRAIRSTQPSRLTGLVVLVAVLALMGGAAGALWHYTGGLNADESDGDAGATTESAAVTPTEPPEAAPSAAGAATAEDKIGAPTERPAQKPADPAAPEPARKREPRVDEPEKGVGAAPAPVRGRPTVAVPAPPAAEPPRQEADLAPALPAPAPTEPAPAPAPEPHAPEPTAPPPAPPPQLVEPTPAVGVPEQQ